MSFTGLGLTLDVRNPLLDIEKVHAALDEYFAKHKDDIEYKNYGGYESHLRVHDKTIFYHSHSCTTHYIEDVMKLCSLHACDYLKSPATGAGADADAATGAGAGAAADAATDAADGRQSAAYLAALDAACRKSVADFAALDAARCQSAPSLAAAAAAAAADADTLAEAGPAAHACGNCQRRPATKLKLCSRCRAVRYCGVECQRADWPAHKLLCKHT